MSIEKKMAESEEATSVAKLAEADVGESHSTNLNHNQFQVVGN